MHTRPKNWPSSRAPRAPIQICMCPWDSASLFLRQVDVARAEAPVAKAEEECALDVLAIVMAQSLVDLEEHIVHKYRTREEGHLVARVDVALVMVPWMVLWGMRVVVVMATKLRGMM